MKKGDTTNMKKSGQILKTFITFSKLFLAAFAIFSALLNFSCCSIENSSQTVSSSTNSPFNSAFRKNKEISLVCWNVQTFFDAETSGSEYSEFKRNKNWNKEAYLTRLKRLAQVMQRLDADIYVLEEIENEQVINDIKNQLYSNAWNPRKTLKYTFFSKENNAAIGCAVLSKYPLTNIKVHSMDIRTENAKQPSSRPIIQLKVLTNASKSDNFFYIFINHWKSKSGGAEQSEIWRNWQEKLLSDSIEQTQKQKQKQNGTDIPCVICGDFNKDILEFKLIRGGKTKENILLGNVPVYSPWIDSNGNFTTETGSYFYKNKWERIDNIFTCGNIHIKAFEAVAEEPWTDAKKIPASYKVYTGQGYSDHLPLRCVLIL